MEISVFTDKENIPSNENLQIAIGRTYRFWNVLRDFVFFKYPNAIEGWNFPGKNYGWSFRIKDKKRAIIYLLPRDGFFKVAFVFGEKATKQILDSAVSSEIKSNLASARVYAEGRGIRIDVIDEFILDDIKKLIEIKLLN